MITFELAKQLKDAGFRQNLHSGYKGDVYYQGLLTPFQAIKDAHYDNGTLICYLYECVVIPTLSELIKSCGNKFSNIEAVYGTKETFYIARYDEEIDQCETCHRMGNKLYRGQGGCPEEAVAYLWLELNKIK